MSNNYWDNDEDDNIDFDLESGDEGKKDARFRDLRKAKRADEKRIKELTEKLESLTKTQNERIVKEILEKQGVNPKAARLALKDLTEEVTEDTVLNWLDDNGELFGYSKQEAASAISDDDMNEIRRQNNVTQGAKTPDRGEDLISRIDSAETAEELSRILFSSES